MPHRNENGFDQARRARLRAMGGLGVGPCPSPSPTTGRPSIEREAGGAFVREPVDVRLIQAAASFASSAEGLASNLETLAGLLERSGRASDEEVVRIIRGLRSDAGVVRTDFKDKAIDLISTIASADTVEKRDDAAAALVELENSLGELESVIARNAIRAQELLRVSPTVLPPIVVVVDDEIENLIRDLGDDDVDVRDQAQNKLVEIAKTGSSDSRKAVIDALRTEASRPDDEPGLNQERRARARALLGSTFEARLERIKETARRLGSLETERIENRNRLDDPSEQVVLTARARLSELAEQFEALRMALVQDVEAERDDLFDIFGRARPRLTALEVAEREVRGTGILNVRQEEFDVLAPSGVLIPDVLDVFVVDDLLFDLAADLQFIVEAEVVRPFMVRGEAIPGGLPIIPFGLAQRATDRGVRITTFTFDELDEAIAEARRDAEEIEKRLTDEFRFLQNKIAGVVVEEEVQIEEVPVERPTEPSPQSFQQQAEQLLRDRTAQSASSNR